MNNVLEEKTLTIYVTASEFLFNPRKMKDELIDLVKQNKEKDINIDLGDFDNIVQSLIDFLVEILKNNENVSLVNLRGNVFDEFRKQGYTNQYPIFRRLLPVTIEGCEEIGGGFFSKFYRLNEDTCVKVYNEKASIDNIILEKEKAKQAMILGVPTAIPFTIVNVDGHFGVLFEYINGKTLGKTILNDKEHIDMWIKKYVDLLLNLKDTKVENSIFPNCEEVYLEKAEYIKDFIAKEDYEKIKEIICSIEDTRSIVHADCHINNIMVSNNEIFLIDLDTLMIGNTIYELAGFYCTYQIFEELYPGNNDEFLKLDKQTVQKILDGIYNSYFGTNDQQIIERNKKRVRLIALIHMLYWIKKYTKEKEESFQYIYSQYKSLVKEVDTYNLEFCS